MFFEVNFPGLDVIEVDKPKFINLDEDPDCHGVPYYEIKDCKDQDEVRKLVDFATDERTILDTGKEVTVTYGQDIDITIKNISKFIPIFNLDFRLSKFYF